MKLQIVLHKNNNRTAQVHTYVCVLHKTSFCITQKCNCNMIGLHYITFPFLHPTVWHARLVRTYVACFL